MSGWLFFGGLLILGLAVVAFEVADSSRDVQSIIAPDIQHSDAIDAEFGADSSEAKAVRKRRFGRHAHWYDALTALVGIAGLAIVYWRWFR